jgi:hypothetical protein
MGNSWPWHQSNSRNRRGYGQFGNKSMNVSLIDATTTVSRAPMWAASERGPCGGAGICYSIAMGRAVAMSEMADGVIEGGLTDYRHSPKVATAACRERSGVFLVAGTNAVWAVASIAIIANRVVAPGTRETRREWRART